MLQWFRARARSIGVITLWSLTMLTAWSAVPHDDDCHDAICSSIAVPHDVSSHSVGRDTSPTERPLHCVLCHRTRIDRPSASAAYHLTEAVDRAVGFHVHVVLAPEGIVAAQPPLRAPPQSAVHV